MKKIILMSLLLFSVLGSSIGQNQPGKERLEAQRIAFITNRLNLTPQEAQSFWPLYNQYKQDEKTLKKTLKRTGLVKDMSDSEISDYLEQSLVVEEKQVALKRKYLTELKKVLPVRKIAKLINAEKAFTKMVVNRLNERRKKRNGN